MVLNQTLLYLWNDQETFYNYIKDCCVMVRRNVIPIIDSMSEETYIEFYPICLIKPEQTEE